MLSDVLAKAVGDLDSYLLDDTLREHLGQRKALLQRLITLRDEMATIREMLDQERSAT
jgi:hypothetical protein